MCKVSRSHLIHFSKGLKIHRFDGLPFIVNEVQMPNSAKTFFRFQLRVERIYL